MFVTTGGTGIGIRIIIMVLLTLFNIKSQDSNFMDVQKLLGNYITKLMGIYNLSSAKSVVTVEHFFLALLNDIKCLVKGFSQKL